MPSYTNMAWPDDPYGTGQLWRKEPPLLAGFAVRWTDNGAKVVPVSYSVVYLRLHRTLEVDLTLGVNFGFRAATAVTEDETEELVRLLDLDAMRARRLAKIVAGYRLAEDLRRIEALADDEVGRGIRSLASAVEAPFPQNPGFARAFDIKNDQVGCGGDLAAASVTVGVAIATARRAFESQQTIDAVVGNVHGLAVAGSRMTSESEINRSLEWLAACATERALICALTAGRSLGRYTWEDTLDISAAMAANAWDCFSSQDFTGRPQLA
jgi:hypothetical protein